MTSDKRDRDPFIGILRRAWHSSQQALPGPRFEERVMSEIRSSQDALTMPAMNGSRSLILRFSLVTAAFAVFLILYVLVSGMLPYRELAMLFMKDPAGFIISAPFV